MPKTKDINWELLISILKEWANQSAILEELTKWFVDNSCIYKTNQGYIIHTTDGQVIPISNKTRTYLKDRGVK